MNGWNVLLVLLGLVLLWMTHKGISLFLMSKMASERKEEIERLNTALANVREKIELIKDKMEVEKTPELEKLLKEALEGEAILKEMLYQAQEQKYHLEKEIKGA